MTTTDSNLWGGRSGHIYTFTRRPGGMTDVDAVVVREDKNLKGRALGFVLGTVGKRVLERAFGNTVRAIEARNSDSIEGSIQTQARQTWTSPKEMSTPRGAGPTKQSRSEAELARQSSWQFEAELRC